MPNVMLIALNLSDLDQIIVGNPRDKTELLSLIT